VNFLHYAGKEYQCEVALLSRRIFIYGNGTVFNGFGGHIMIMYWLFPFVASCFYFHALH